MQGGASQQESQVFPDDLSATLLNWDQTGMDISMDLEGLGPLPGVGVTPGRLNPPVDNTAQNQVIGLGLLEQLPPAELIDDL